MNEYIARRSLDEYSLAEYLETAAVVDDLYHRIGELEDTISALDENIETAEHSGLDEVVEALCKSRNNLNLNRLDLEIELHKLEIKLAKFEKIRMLTK